MNDQGEMTVSQWNLHRSEAPAIDISQILLSNPRSIGLLQEPPWAVDHVSGLLPGIRVFHGAPGQQRARACIAVHSSIQAILHPEFSSADLCTVELTAKQGRKPIILASLYCPYNNGRPNGLPTAMFKRLVRHCTRTNTHLVIGSDANSHHVQWGSTDTNARGEALLEYLTTTNLTIANRGNTPTFVVANRQEVIDITMANPGGANILSDWAVSGDSSSSDHRILSFKLNFDGLTREGKYRNIRKTNWTEYRETLNTQLTLLQEISPTSQEELDQNTEQVHTAITEAFHAACPELQPKISTKPRWFSGDLRTLKKNKSRAWRHATRSQPQSPQLWEAYTEAQRVYNRELKRAKKEGWRQYTSEIEKLPQASRLHKILKSDRKRDIGMLRKADNSYTSTPEEALDLLLETHFPDPPAGEQPPPIQEQPAQQFPDHLINEIITERKVAMALHSLKPYKAPGPDGIHPVLLREGLNDLTRPLTQLFKASLKLGYVPKIWRDSRVVFLPKPGRDDYSIPKSYRPISLTSFLLKTIERLILWHLNEGPLKHRPLQTTQYAYRAGRSTETALHHLTTEIERSIYAREYAIGVSLDVDGAFPNASVTGMINALSDTGADPQIVNWVRFMLLNRQVQADLAGKQSTRLILRGCPQGGILSPVLWNLLIDGLLRHLRNKPCEVFTYADDVFLLSRARTLDLANARMQRSLNATTTWGTQHQLRFVPAKTKGIVFTNRRLDLPYLDPLTIADQPITMYTEIKYLGVTINRQLNWKPHITEKIQRARMSLGHARRVVGNTWGFTPQIMKWLYLSVIRPAITYGSIVWAPATRLKTIQEKLRSVQRQALIAITSAFPFTPTRSLELLTGIPPLHWHIQETATKTASRLHGLNEWRGHRIPQAERRGHIALSRQLMGTLDGLSLTQDTKLKTMHFERPYKVSAHTDGTPQRPPLPTVPPGEIHIYTDGSKSNGRTGAASITLDGNTEQPQQIPLGTRASVFQAEVIAITHAAIALTERNTIGQKIIFHSDSQAALNALQSLHVTSHTVHDCATALEQLAQSNDVELQWVKAHVGLEGNETADQLAKQATEIHGPEPFTPIPPDYIKRQLREWQILQHTTEWTNTVGHETSKEAGIRYNPAFTEALLSKRRVDVRNIIQVLTGHCGLARHLNTMHLIPSPRCQMCNIGPQETPLHYLGECPRYTAIRTATLGGPILDWQDIQLIPLNKLLSYIHQTDRLNIDNPDNLPAINPQP